MIKNMGQKIINMCKNTQSITISGNNCSNISMTNGKVIIDGKEYKADKNGNVVVNGDVDGLNVGAINVIINGNVNGNVKTSSGDIEIKNDVKGNVQSTSGDIEIKNCYGSSVKTTSGDVEINKKYS